MTPECEQWRELVPGHFAGSGSEFAREAMSMYAALLSARPALRDVSIERLRRNPELVNRILAQLDDV